MIEALFMLFILLLLIIILPLVSGILALCIFIIIRLFSKTAADDYIEQYMEEFRHH